MEGIEIHEIDDVEESNPDPDVPEGMVRVSQYCVRPGQPPFRQEVLIPDPAPRRRRLDELSESHRVFTNKKVRMISQSRHAARVTAPDPMIKEKEIRERERIKVLLNLPDEEDAYGNPFAIQVKRLERLVSKFTFYGNNNLLHGLVLRNSNPHHCESEHHGILRLLSLSEVPVNALNDDGFSALHLATLKENDVMLEAMLSYVSNINIQTETRNGETALHLAVRSNKCKLVRILLAHGAEVNGYNRWKKIPTPLYLAMVSGNSEIIQTLLTADADKDTAFHVAVLKDNCQVAEKLLAMGADVNSDADFGGYSALHVAILSGNLSMVKILLANNCDVHVKSFAEQTALHYAVKRSLEIAEAIIDSGASLNDKDFAGRTILHYAAGNMTTDMVKLLIEKGQAIIEKKKASLKNDDGEDVSDMTVPYPDLNATNSENQTPLHEAVIRGNVTAVLSLLKRGCDVNVRDFNLATALHYAEKNGFDEIKTLLIAEKATL